MSAIDAFRHSSSMSSRLRSAESTNLKTSNELQIDVLKSDIKRLQEELQTVSKVNLLFFCDHWTRISSRRKTTREVNRTVESMNCKWLSINSNRRFVRHADALDRLLMLLLKIGTVAAEQNHQLRTNNAEYQRILDEKESLFNQTILDQDQLRTDIEVWLTCSARHSLIVFRFDLAIQRSLRNPDANCSNTRTTSDE